MGCPAPTQGCGRERWRAAGDGIGPRLGQHTTWRRSASSPVRPAVPPFPFHVFRRVFSFAVYACVFDLVVLSSCHRRPRPPHFPACMEPCGEGVAGATGGQGQAKVWGSQGGVAAPTPPNCESSFAPADPDVSSPSCRISTPPSSQLPTPAPKIHHHLHLLLWVRSLVRNQHRGTHPSPLFTPCSRAFRRPPPRLVARTVPVRPPPQPRSRAGERGAAFHWPCPHPCVSVSGGSTARRGGGVSPPPPLNPRQPLLVLAI